MNRRFQEILQFSLLLGAFETAWGVEHWRRDFVNLTVPDGGAAVQRDFVVTNLPSDAVITEVEAGFRCIHPYAADLSVDLRGPTGILFSLWDRDGGSSPDPEWWGWTSAFNGAGKLLGTWSFVCRDWATPDAGYLDSCYLRIYFTTFQGAYVQSAQVVSFISLENRDADEYHEQYSFEVQADANYGGAGTRAIDAVLYSPDLSYGWDWPSWSISGLSQDWQAQQYSDNSLPWMTDETSVYFELWLFDLPTAGQWSGTLWESEVNLSGAPVKLEPTLPELVSASVQNVWYDLTTDPDGDSYYQEFTYEIWVVADAAPLTTTYISAVIRCVETGEEYTTSPWGIYSNDRVSEKFYLDETNFGGFQNNTDLHFIVELWGGSGPVELAQSFVTGQAIRADNNQAAADVTVSGQVYFLNEDSQVRPVRYCQVLIVDTATGQQDPAVRTYSSYTDASGRYALQIPNNLVSCPKNTLHK